MSLYVDTEEELMLFVSELDESLARDTDKILKYANLLDDQEHEIGLVITEYGLFITISDNGDEVTISYKGNEPTVMYHTHPFAPAKPSYADVRSTIKHNPKLDIIKGNNGFFVINTEDPVFKRLADRYKLRHGTDKRRVINEFLKDI